MINVFNSVCVCVEIYIYVAEGDEKTRINNRCYTISSMVGIILVFLIAHDDTNGNRDQ